MSVIVKSAGGGSAKPELFTYVLQTESGDEGLLQYVGVEEVTLTAVAEDIKIGKVAINEEGVVTGTHVCPTVKELTADADATANDILNGKTAYVNGEKITGTAVGKQLVVKQSTELGTPNTDFITNVDKVFIVGTHRSYGNPNIYTLLEGETVTCLSYYNSSNSYTCTATMTNGIVTASGGFNNNGLPHFLYIFNEVT